MSGECDTGVRVLTRAGMLRQAEPRDAWQPKETQP